MLTILCNCCYLPTAWLKILPAWEMYCSSLLNLARPRGVIVCARSTKLALECSAFKEEREWLQPTILLNLQHVEAFWNFEWYVSWGILFSTVHLVWHILDRSHKLIYHWFPTKTLSAGSGNLVGNQYKAPKRRRYPSHCVRPGSVVAQHLQKLKKKALYQSYWNLRGPFLVKNVYIPKTFAFLRHFCWMIDTFAPQDSMKTTSPRWCQPCHLCKKIGSHGAREVT